MSSVRVNPRATPRSRVADDQGPKLLKSQVYQGTNRYHNTTVIRQRTDLGKLAGRQTSDNLPLGHALFELILSLDVGARIMTRRVHRIDYAEIHDTSKPGVLDFVWSTDMPGISRDAAQLGMARIGELIESTTSEQRFRRSAETAPKLSERLRKRALRRRLTHSAALLLKAAHHRGLPCEPVTGAYLQFGHGAMRQVLNPSLNGLLPSRSPATEANSPQLEQLSRLGLPTLSDLASYDFDTVSASRLRVLVLGGRVVSVLRAISESEQPDATGYKDVTDRISDNIRKLAEHASKCLDLPNVDLDIICRKLSSRSNDAIIAGVSDSLDISPYAIGADTSRSNLGVAALDLLLPSHCGGRIPSVAVYGSTDGESVCRSTSQKLTALGYTVGVALGDSATVADQDIPAGSLGRQGAIRYLMSDHRVEALITMASPDRAISRGLVLDRVDVAAVLCPGPDDDHNRYKRGLEIISSAATDVLVTADNPFLDTLQKFRKSMNVAILQESNSLRASDDQTEHNRAFAAGITEIIGPRASGADKV